MNAPDWLKLHGGALKLGSDRTTWYVLFTDKPHYALRPVPVAGKIGCAIRQTINGQRIESKGAHGTEDEALRGGLEDLRGVLGW